MTSRLQPFRETVIGYERSIVDQDNVRFEKFPHIERREKSHLIAYLSKMILLFFFGAFTNRFSVWHYEPRKSVTFIVHDGNEWPLATLSVPGPEHGFPVVLYCPKRGGTHPKSGEFDNVV